MTTKTQDTFSTYNPIINFTFFIGAIVLGMFFVHPAYLIASVVASSAYLITINRQKAIKSIGVFAVMFVIISLINPLFNTTGSTVLFTYFGRAYTLEALYYGMSTGALFVSIMLWFSSYNLIMTSDKFLYMFGKLIPGLSLILTMVLRLVPSYQRKANQISTARICIGMGAEGTETKDKVNNAMTILGTLTSWALEGGIVTADSMRSRGYGCGARTSFSMYRFELKDKLLTILMIVLISCVVLTSLKGALTASYIPTVDITPINSVYSVIGICSYIAFLSIPTLLNIKEAVTWHILISKI